MHSFLSRLCHAPIRRRAVVMLVALAWSSLAFCGEIHDAARAGDLGKVKALLKGNPYLVFSKDKYGETPLHHAVLWGHRDVAELLVASKAEVNAKTDGAYTPLHWAALRGQKAVVKLLLTNKPDVNAKSTNGATPLHNASLKGYQDVVELLRLHGGHSED